MVSFLDFEGTNPDEAAKGAADALTSAKERLASSGHVAFLMNADSVEELEARAEMRGVREAVDAAAEEVGRDKLIASLKREFEAAGYTPKALEGVGEGPWNPSPAQKGAWPEPYSPYSPYKKRIDPHDLRPDKDFPYDEHPHPGREADEEQLAPWVPHHEPVAPDREPWGGPAEHEPWKGPAEHEPWNPWKDKPPQKDRWGNYPKISNKYIKHRGDKWVIIQKGTGKVLSEHDSEVKAEASFRAMEMHKHHGGIES
jgi:hypothetical protein